MNDALIQFAQRYLEMRQAQSDYFTSKTKLRLERSKALERALDADAKRILSSAGVAPEKKDEPKQGTLL